MNSAGASIEWERYALELERIGREIVAARGGNSWVALDRTIDNMAKLVRDKRRRRWQDRPEEVMPNRVHLRNMRIVQVASATSEADASSELLATPAKEVMP